MSTDRNPENGTSRMGRFAKITIVLTIVLCAAWTAVWIGARTMLESYADEFLADGSNGNAKLYCNDRQIGGFPFQMAFSCSSAGLAVTNDNLSASLGGLDMVALVYRPQHVIADLKSPLDVNWNGAASPVKGNWSAGRTSIRLAEQALARLSAEFDGLTIATGLQSAVMVHSEFHIQPAGENQQTDIAFTARDAAISIASETSAPFSIDTTIRVDLPPEVLLAGQLDHRDIIVPDLQIRLSAADSLITASGALDIGRSGMTNGNIVVVTENPAALAGFLQTLPAPVRNQTTTFIGAMIALSKPAKNDLGTPVSELTLSIRDNAIYAGTRKIGELTPVL